MAEARSAILAESKQARILRAAAGLGAERDYEEIDLALIASDAGVEKTEIEERFIGVEECMAEAISATLSEILAVVAASYSADRSEFDSGLAGMKAILELMAANPSLAYLTYIGCRQGGSPGARAVYQGGVTVISAMIGRLCEYSSLETDPASAPRAALGAAEALVRREVATGQSENLPALLPDLAYGVTVPFLGQEEALGMAARARKLLLGTPWSGAE